MNNKEKAIDFLQLVVAGQIDDAYDKYVDMQGKHHNFYFSAGFLELQNAMKENHEAYPEKKFIIKHVLWSDDLVATHSCVSVGDKSLAAFHLLRFNNGKIIEMWDVGQEIPMDLPNSDGPF